MSPLRDSTDTSDAAVASKILRGIRDRVTRLEQRDRTTEDHAVDLRVRSDTARADDRIRLRVFDRTLEASGFGQTPFGDNFGDPDIGDDNGNGNGNGDGDDDDTGTGTGTGQLVQEIEVFNTTTIGYHRHVAECTLHEGAFPPRPDQIAFGSGDGPFSSGNEELGDRIGSVTIDSSSTIEGGVTAILQTQIDTSEFVGESLRELAVESSDNDRMFNHAPIQPTIHKTEDLEIIVEARLRIVDSTD